MPRFLICFSFAIASAREACDSFQTSFQGPRKRFVVLVPR